MKYPKTIQSLIEGFQKYPGIGQKTAERLALYSFTHMDEDAITSFSDALKQVKTDIQHCDICGNMSDQPTCEVCRDSHRDQRVIMVVESVRDVIAIEKTIEYHGLYHVLNGVVDFTKGIGIDDINLTTLPQRARHTDEIIIATNATVEGEMTAQYIKSLLENHAAIVTRIAHGLPVGGDLEYADDMTLLKALEGRRNY